MKYLKYFRFMFVVTALASAPNVQSQSLFAKPDTTPDYRSYQYIEECRAAALRITAIEKSLSRDTIWWDTVPRPERQGLKEKLHIKSQWVAKRPESAIKAANECLEKYDADTAKILSRASLRNIISVLLVAHRDEDAEGVARRFLDSMRREVEKQPDSLKKWIARRMHTVGLLNIAEEYGEAHPVRYEAANRYLDSAYSAFRREGDSLYYSVEVLFKKHYIAMRMEDTLAAEAIGQQALLINDSMFEGERLTGGGARVAMRRNDWLEGVVTKMTQEESLDSLAVSNLAYNLWYANTVRRRVRGGELITKDSEQVQPKKLPELTGDYYYVPNNVTTSTAAGSGKVTYTKKGAVPTGEFPIKKSINYIVTLPSLCHPETKIRGEDFGGEDVQLKSVLGPACLDHASEIRYIKREFPEIEITGLTNTYGTVGQLGPLTPDQNADTLARHFLGFHRLPVRLVVENTKFYYLTKPDGRRIDISTPNSDALERSVKDVRYNQVTDKDGYMINIHIDGSDWFRRAYEILINRPSK